MVQDLEDHEIDDCNSIFSFENPYYERYPRRWPRVQDDHHRNLGFLVEFFDLSG